MKHTYIMYRSMGTLDCLDKTIRECTSDEISNLKDYVKKVIRDDVKWIVDDDNPYYIHSNIIKVSNKNYSGLLNMGITHFYYYIEREIKV